MAESQATSLNREIPATMVRLHGQIAPGKFVEVNLAGLHTQDNEPKVDQNLITFPTWLSHVEVWSLQSNQRLLKT